MVLEANAIQPVIETIGWASVAWMKLFPCIQIMQRDWLRSSTNGDAVKAMSILAEEHLIFLITVKVIVSNNEGRVTRWSKALHAARNPLELFGSHELGRVLALEMASSYRHHSFFLLFFFSVSCFFGCR